MVDRCAVWGCSKKSEDTHGFCADHADEIFDEAVCQIEDVLEISSKVYFGRTAFPEQRLLQHMVSSQRDHLLVMHWMANWAEAKEFEESLISAFKEQSKFNRVENQALGSEGAHSGSWSALYVSFALKHGYPLPPGATVIENLHWRKRLWPSPTIPYHPILLRYDLTKDEAQKELDRFREATDPARPRQGRVPKAAVRKARSPCA